MTDQEIEAAKAASIQAWDAQAALRTALHEDVLAIGALVDQQPSSQALRRAFVRSCWGYIEGSTHGATEFLRVLEDTTDSVDLMRSSERGGTLELLRSD